jgi:hypothetical protein
VVLKSNFLVVYQEVLFSADRIEKLNSLAAELSNAKTIKVNILDKAFDDVILLS